LSLFWEISWTAGIWRRRQYAPSKRR